MPSTSIPVMRSPLELVRLCTTILLRRKRQKRKQKMTNNAHQRRRSPKQATQMKTQYRLRFLFLPSRPRMVCLLLAHRSILPPLLSKHPPLPSYSISTLQAMPIFIRRHRLNLDIYVIIFTSLSSNACIALGLPIIVLSSLFALFLNGSFLPFLYRGSPLPVLFNARHSR